MATKPLATKDCDKLLVLVGSHWVRDKVVQVSFTDASPAAYSVSNIRSFLEGDDLFLELEVEGYDSGMAEVHGGTGGIHIHRIVLGAVIVSVDEAEVRDGDTGQDDRR